LQEPAWTRTGRARFFCKRLVSSLNFAFGMARSWACAVVGDSADTSLEAGRKLRPSGSISIRYDYTVTRVFPTGRTQNGIDAAGGQQERFAFPEEARRGVAAPRMRTKIGGQRGGARVVSGAPCVEREVPAAALCGLAWHAKNDGGAGRTPVGLVILGQTRGGAQRLRPRLENGGGQACGRTASKHARALRRRARRESGRRWNRYRC